MPLLNPHRLQTALQKNAVSPIAVDALPALAELFGAGATAGYTAELVERVVEYQISVGQSPDGVITKDTLQDLRKRGWLDGASCASLWPARESSDAERKAHYVALGARAGAPLGTRALLLGIRGVYPEARRAHPTSHAQRYDDTFVLLAPKAPPFVFRGATHAYQIWSARKPDLNGDRLGDAGVLRPGRYVLELGSGEPPEFAITAGSGSALLPVRRDAGHDAVLGKLDEELARTVLRGLKREGSETLATEVLFHPGYETIEPSSRRPFSSIASQTAPLAELRRLRAAGNVLDYALTTVDDLLLPFTPRHRPT
jgi:hypothetical protein